MRKHKEKKTVDIKSLSNQAESEELKKLLYQAKEESQKLIQSISKKTQINLNIFKKTI